MEEMVQKSTGMGLLYLSADIEKLGIAIGAESVRGEARKMILHFRSLGLSFEM